MSERYRDPFERGAYVPGIVPMPESFACPTEACTFVMVETTRLASVSWEGLCRDHGLHRWNAEEKRWEPKP